jgi:hypothetical protein
MKTAVSELDRATFNMDPHQNLKRIRQARAAAIEKRDNLSLSIKENEKKLVLAEADQIYSDSAVDERSETLRATLAQQRAELLALGCTLEALTIAEEKATKACQAADRADQVATGRELLRKYRDAIARLTGLMDEAEGVNNELIQLDMQLRSSGLGEAGIAKAITTLARSGASWNALQFPMVGVPIHVKAWRQHIRNTLGDE